MSGRPAPPSGEAKVDLEMNGHEVEMVLVEHEPLIKGSVTTKRQRSYPTDEISELDEPGSSGTKDGSEGGRSGIQKRLNSKSPERLPFSRQYLQRSFREVLLGTRLNILLFAIPAAIIANQLNLSPGIIFAISLVGITPLAERLGFVTEQLAMYTGPTAGGLLNATFGNATEMIISLFALRSGKIRVVQLSLLGSILSNMLLVLGCAFLAGGFKFKTQKFNKGVTQTSSGLLLMSVMGLLFPATLHMTHTEAVNGTSELTLSRFSSCIMLLSYGVYLFFQLHSHKELYDGDQGGDDDDDDEEAILGFWGGICWLAVITLFISILSEFIVDAIDGAAQAWHIPVTFISVIILPIVGNAAEHASAVVFAMKDHLDLSLGVAIGSSTQIAMFVIPFCVVVGGLMGQKMDLNFHVFETSVLFITVLVVAFMLQEGRANYFKGLMLVFCYLIVGASFYVHTDHDE